MAVKLELYRVFRAVAEKGGVVGMNFYSLFLRAGAGSTSIRYS